MMIQTADSCKISAYTAQHHILDKFIFTFTAVRT